MDDFADETVGGKPAKKGPAHPNQVARELLESRTFVTDRGGTVYLFTGAYWREITEAHLHAIAMEGDGEFHTKLNRRREIIGYIKGATLDPDLKWGRVADWEVACADCVVDVRSGATRDHAAEDYLERVLPVAWNRRAQCSLWTEALDAFFVDDIERRDALQDFFGYIVLSHAKFKQALLLYGPKDTGKSLIIKVAQYLVGIDHCCQLSVEAMDDPVKLEVIVGKGLNLITELSADAMIKDGGFKTLVSTEEPLLVNPKYKPAMMYTPRAKHIIATNNLPRINDRTEATVDRLLIIPLTKVFRADEQDRTLAEKIAAQELDGVLVWAIEGAKRLIERAGQWVKPSAALTILDDYREAQNPMKAFLREKTVLDETSAVTLSKLTEEFNRWHGGKKLSVRQVGDLCRKAGQTVKSVRHDEFIHTSLVGFRLAHDDIPSELTLDAEDVRSAAETIDSRHKKVTDAERPLDPGGLGGA